MKFLNHKRQKVIQCRRFSCRKALLHPERNPLITLSKGKRLLHITTALRASSKDAFLCLLLWSNENKIKKLALCDNKRLSIKLEEMVVARSRTGTGILAFPSS